MARQDLPALALVAVLLLVSSLMLAPTANAQLGMTEAVPVTKKDPADRPLKKSTNEDGIRRNEAAILPTTKADASKQMNGFDDNPQAAVKSDGTTGRKLNQAWKGPFLKCSYTLINACASKKKFQAVFAYQDPAGGYTTDGWYGIQYGKKFTYTGYSQLWVYTTTYQRPTTYWSDDEGEFCVSEKPFTFRSDVRGLNLSYYVPKCDSKGKCSGWKYATDSCWKLYGNADYQDDFWSPTSCGMTVTYYWC